MMTPRSWQSRSILPLAILTCVTWACVAPAQQAVPQKIDVSRLKSQVEEVVIPVPSEIFNALDKLGGNPNWHSVLLPVSSAKPHVEPEIAMLLGTVIANGFVAVEAKDKESVEKIGRKVIDLAQALSVREAVLAHCNSIIEGAHDGDWASVRSELDRAQSSVRDAMGKLNSKDEAELISIAGWLRGTQALTSLITQDYKPERSELLHQPDMLVTFEGQFNRMDKKVQDNKTVEELRAGLQKIKPLIPTGGNDAISQKSVEQINGIVTGLVKTIAP